MIRVIAMLAVIAATGACASVDPYLEAEVKYAFPFGTDYWIHPDRSWTCGEPYQLDLEIGADLPRGWSAGVYHESFLFCGGPLNHKPEVTENGAFVKRKWGGR